MKNNLGEEFGSFPVKMILGGLGFTALFHFAGIEIPRIKLTPSTEVANQCDTDKNGKTSETEVEACWVELLSSGGFDTHIKREP